MAGATLKLELTTAAGADLNDFVRVELFNANSPAHTQNNLQATRFVQINGIETGAASTFKVVITPSNYRLVQFFIMLGDGQSLSKTVAFPVDPARVANLVAPGFNALSPIVQSLLNQSQIPRFVTPAGAFIQGQDLYFALDNTPKLKACLLNITTKSGATPLRDGSTCLDHYRSMVRMEQDRLFVQITPDLIEEVENSPLFHSVSAALHDPVPGYHITESFKTFDRYGNLQLTFQRRGDTGTDYIADVDIDDAQGIEHLFQVVRNLLTGPTNPYDIHDILIIDQKMDPGYSFVFGKSASVSA